MNEIWLEWLKDEIRLTEEESNREGIYELFEKAVKDYICPDIWLEYAQYSIGGMGSAGGLDKVRAIFERALTAVGLHMTKGSAVWDAYREFENVMLSTVQPPAGGVPSSEEQVKRNTQLERIHTLFRRQLAVPFMDEPLLTSTCVLWCRAYGDAAHCRKALHRAVQCSSDYPDHVCEVLLTFERVEGSLEDWDAAVQKTDTRLGRLTEQRARVAAKEAQQAGQEEGRVEQRRKAKVDKKAQKKKSQQQQQGGRRAGDNKRKAERADIQEAWEEDAERAPKRHKGGAGGTEKKKEEEDDDDDAEDMETEMGLFGRRKPGARPKGPPPPGANKKPQQQQPASTSASSSSSSNPELRVDGNSVFISNLAYTLAEPEQKLRALFERCGPVAQVRPVFSKAGGFKGYGYLQFESKVSVPEALKLDRQEVEGRPMFVSPCVDKNANPDFKVFKYNSALEKHKVFISGLPFSCTKQQLAELCQGHGTVKDIRLVTYRSGKPKGLAYVEFGDETQASHAVLGLDGTVMGDNKITVSISNPPRKNPMDQGGAGGPMSALKPRQVHGSRGRGRTQVSLLPRSLHRPSGSVGKAENGTAPADDDQAFKKPAKPLSNSDFAKMLLKK
ncbi:hypothetical protein CRUP_032263 [Coryphaenoides rupestris]|nr:hypothetical protein CRUP_032263 [Coryphaenoides rupestris]